MIEHDCEVIRSVVSKHKLNGYHPQYIAENICSKNWAYDDL